MARPDFDQRTGYLAACKKMGFDELGAFIRASVREPPGFGQGPRTKQALLEVLEMLAGKGGLIWSPSDGDRVWKNEDLVGHRKLSAQRERARRSLSIAEGAVPREMRLRGETSRRVLKERRSLAAVERQIALLEKKADPQEDEPEAAPADAHDRAKHQYMLARRRRAVAGILREVEAAFPAGNALADVPQMGRLPWRVLPPGELTLETVLAHYRGLARERPGSRLEPERIEKAHSLGPTMWWEGSDGFEGYVVFEYPRTERVLLECGLYGNAIYVLGPDWQGLSRLSKREVLKHPSTTRIVHRGAWFETVKAELGLR